MKIYSIVEPASRAMEKEKLFEWHSIPYILLGVFFLYFISFVRVNGLIFREGFDKKKASQNVYGCWA